MSVGIKIPFQVSHSGGIVLNDTSEQDEQIIRTALGDCDNENAFQQGIGLGNDMVFATNDPDTQKVVLAKLVAVFDVFTQQKRFKLLQDTISWTDNGDGGEMMVTFRYINLETDDVRQFPYQGVSNDGGAL